MKKNFRFVLALVLAAMMIASAALAETQTHTITITAPAGHTYEVFQVLRGNVDANNSNQLNNLLYGTNSAKGTAGERVSIADVQALEALANATYADDQAKIAAYKVYVNFDTNPVTVATGTATAALEEGWYVIRDKKNTAPAGEGETLYMFKVLNADLSISAKSDKPSSEKKVDDNDSDGTLNDSADYDIGDTIKYTLTFTLPSDYANYLHYKATFKDTMSGGLTYNGDAKIFYGPSDTTGTAINFGTAAAAGTATNLQFATEDLKGSAFSSYNLKAGDKIKIEYTAYLNSQAVIGSAGNPNTYTVDFTRNPNWDGTGTPDTGTTPEDKNIVFTYKSVFDKVDENQQPLDGADFTLYKKTGSGENDWTDVTLLNTSAAPAKVGTSAGHTFSFTGLDAGQYKLVETTVPAGYNKMQDIVFTINAQHQLEADDPKLTSLTATGGLDITGDLGTGTLTTSVVNESGVVLPSTGGIGTTIFYVAGSILVLAAAILLVTKRRMGAND